MNIFKHKQLIRILTTMTIISISAGMLPATTAFAADMSNGAANFYKSEKVIVQKANTAPRARNDALFLKVLQ